MYFYSNVTEVCFYGSSWQWSVISSGNGLVPSRWQAIIWTNEGLVYWHTHIIRPQWVSPWCVSPTWIWNINLDITELTDGLAPVVLDHQHAQCWLQRWYNSLIVSSAIRDFEYISANRMLAVSTASDCWLIQLYLVPKELNTMWTRHEWRT